MSVNILDWREGGGDIYLVQPFDVASPGTLVSYQVSGTSEGKIHKLLNLYLIVLYGCYVHGQDNAQTSFRDIGGY